MTRIGEAFERARAEKRAALIAYLTAGDPSREETVSLAQVLEEAGVDILELGVPFSDPIADGPVLQRSAARALAAGTSLQDVLAIGRMIRKKTRLGLLLFSYLNPLLRRGVARLAGEAKEAGFDAVLVTDLPPEEAGGFQPVLRAAGLDTVFLVSPTSPASRMRGAAKLSSGFLYVVSRPGTTGERQSLPPDLSETVGRARQAARSLPIAVGFGISSPRTASEAARLADGVVVGSALVRVVEEAVGPNRAKALSRLARSLALACRSRAK